MHWPREEVDSRLQQIMKSIHENCVKYGKERLRHQLRPRRQHRRLRQGRRRHACSRAWSDIECRCDGAGLAVACDTQPDAA